MIAIIGVLVALLLPAVQAARESARRTACNNNLRQIGIAAHNYYNSRSSFPVGAESKSWTKTPGTPWSFYRWSALAYLVPFLEEGSAIKMLDLTMPLYSSNLAVTPQNTPGAAQMVPLFLCPSDVGQAVATGFGPTNYAACGGSGANGGSPIATDGIFYVNSNTRMSQIPDGTSHTALFGESILGRALGAPTLHDPQVDYKYLLGAPLSTAICSSTPQWNVSQGRGFSWVSGEFRSAMYNHYYLPNSTTPDCIGTLMSGGAQYLYTAYGLRAARSRHPGGASMMMADGSVQFVVDEIDAATWTAWSTRAGNELITTTQVP